eukprot:CAMPEP_0202921880 /NCGR_PEP_ID=MMETSP1392-20130828/77617_1 /ASSEMBLY_ACC=CAM_ASM_000868 /TAXON_ID=225041 /ORGANISM="Chlamydomonas chlamydogama, Strain SAG 11-48b" /LENGTH=614 /DNA_ID=CAMNT_0049615479 /DNA_START=109 /DNA_END=1953 /DNA_ORIENTATION=+
MFFLALAFAARLPLDHTATKAVASPSPPSWPSSFEMQYTLTLPYVASLQTVGLKIPVHIWYDGLNSKTRTDVYNGLDSTLVLPGATYNTYPRIDVRDCIMFNNTAGPTLGSLLGYDKSDSPLPDISQWLYAGSTKVAGGVAAYMWQLTQRHAEKTNTYVLYTAQQDGRPLKLYMIGVNILTGSHFDEYLIEFSLFNKLWPGSTTIFKPPATCREEPDAGDQAPGRQQLLQLAALLPASLIGSGASATAAAEKLHAGITARTSSSIKQQAQVQAGRLQQLEFELKGAAASPASAHEYVRLWNQERAAAAGFKLASNRFAGWSDSHFRATRLGRRPSARQLQGQQQGQGQQAPGRLGRHHLGVFRRRLSRDQLPAEVDWRGSGADGLVKDQASCGSCWTFGATGTMTGTWFVATGESLSFSEQQIVDCSWDYDVNGCWGGDGGPALDYIVDAGGAALEDDYPYLGQNGFCASNKTSKAAKFSGYETTPQGDEEALMEALATRGPLYVALDADHPSFKYYSEGVYHRDDCATAPDELDHAVVLVGYGTTPEGVDYWLIRNSWSKLWGEDGYIKISRKGNDCGITSAAVQAVPDAAAAAAARARLAAAADRSRKQAQQ